ncbi:GTP-binding protein [Streptomyces sp. NPDC086989]|uniref:GTP-binding protein n=1 Tax=Streptomyces sp. NPDC086989 TaxID=3365764 RepID=UPI00381EE469
MTGLWSQAGAVARTEPSGTRGPDSAQGQELVFIGAGLAAGPDRSVTEASPGFTSRPAAGQPRRC